MAFSDVGKSDDIGGGFDWSKGLGLGALGAGAGALGFMMGKGPQELPPQFQAMQANVPWLQINANEILQQGKGLTAQGAEALAMAQRGELTAPQQAALKQYTQGLTNTARQTYAQLGRDPTKDTSFVSTQANIDTQVNAMANEQIRSTIALGMAELQGGSGLIGQGLAYDTAANNILLQMGNAQLAQDKSYNDSLTSMFGTIGKMAGTILPAMMI